MVDVYCKTGEDPLNSPADGSDDSWPSGAFGGKGSVKSYSFYALVAIYQFSIVLSVV